MLPLPRASAANPSSCLLLSSKRASGRLCSGKTRDAGVTALSSGGGITTPGPSRLQATPRFSFCLHEKLPELDLYAPPRLSQTPPLFHSHPLSGHAFQERSSVHQRSLHTSTAAGTASQWAHRFLTVAYLMADGSPRGGCGLTRQEGRLPFPREDGCGHCHQPPRGHLGLRPSPQACLC